MSSQIQALLGNHVENLYEQLKIRLFSSETNPFTKRLIVVPSPAMKGWLMQRLADDLDIAAGIQVTFLDPAMKWIQETLTDSKNSYTLPSRQELALLIEREIHVILECEEDPLWSPLITHVKNDSDTAIGWREERRVIALSDQLATLFVQYEKYGREMLKEWQQSKDNEWQQSLWCRVLNQVGPDQLHWKKENVTIHIFALSYLSTQQHQLLMGASMQVSVDYYLLSPCEVYWSDLLSDKASIKLYRRWEQLGLSERGQIDADEILFERNPLLANWGKLGRMMGAQVDETLYQIEEHYQENTDENSLLEALQNDLLLLRNCKNLPKRLYENDKSIQLHVAPNKMREVEVVYHAVLKLIKEDQTICPKDIIVMAPNIMEYDPYIRAIFHGKESALDCQIMDLKLLSHNDLIKGFIHLLHLPQTRWDAQSILKLFGCTAFQEKHHLTPHDVSKLTKWVKEAKICWGVNSDHRTDLLLKQHCMRPMSDTSEVGTWKKGFDRLLLGMAMIAPNDGYEKAEFQQLPLKEVSSTEQELLGKAIALLAMIKEDLKPLGDGKKRELSEWSEYLHLLLERYFSWVTLGESEKEQIEQLFRAMRGLSEIESLRHEKYGFGSVLYHLEKALDQKRLCYRENHLQAVRFCSMLPMRALPAKVVVLMGMEEENYPRRDSQVSLNQLYHHPKADPFPTATDFDRYLFLEAVLSARKSLILTYSHPAKNEGKEGACSLLIAELMGYLDRGFIVEEKKPSLSCLYTHPFYSFDRNYFSPNSLTPSFSKVFYRAAKSYYQVEKQEKHAFMPRFVVNKEDKNGIEEIEIKHLALLARNPIAFYFNRHLGMYLGNDEEQLVSIDESFMISTLDNARLKKGALKSSINSVLGNAESEGDLPVGPFKNYAINKLSKEHDEWSENLRLMNIDVGHSFSIECSDNYDTPIFNEKKWCFPPLKVSVNGKKVELVGTLDQVCSEGLIVYQNDNKKEIGRVWPQFLVWCQLIHQYQLSATPQIIFVKSGKSKTAFFSDPSLYLGEYVNYYQLALHDMSPLIPEWIPEIIESSPEAFQKKIEQTLSERNEHFYNDYVKWMVKGSDYPKSEEIMCVWKGIAENVFSEMIDNWYGKKKVKK